MKTVPALNQFKAAKSWPRRKKKSCQLSSASSWKRGNCN